MTVMPTKQPRPSGDWAMPSTGRSWAGIEVMSRPWKRIEPRRTGRRPETVFRVVVLPAPLAPMRVTTSPSSTVNETLRIASMRP